MIRSLTPEVDRMRYSNFLTVLCLSLVLISCSNSPTQKPPNDLRKFPDDPQSIFIEMMNYMLPMEVDGITMLNVFPEGEKGIVFPLVGDIPIPENLDGLKTDMLNNMFSGMARQQICLEGTRALFKSGVYVKFRFRNKTSSNQIDVIVDEETCQYDVSKPEYKLAETDSAISQTESNNSIKSTTEKYEFVLGQVSWSEAQEQAAEMGGYLACPNSAEEAYHIRNVVMPIKNRKIAWIGLTDEITEGKWLCNGSEVDIESIEKEAGWKIWLNRGRPGELSKRNFAHTMGRPGLLSRENSGVIPKGVKGRQFVEGFVVEWD
jgi:hypothetical protein